MATLAGRNLPAKARARGLRVLEWSGWEGKSEGSFDANGVLLHHDAMALGYVDNDLGNNLNVVKNMSQDGANGAQLWIGLDTAGLMTLVFMKAGRANHAGTGSGFRSIPADMGNMYLVGIETDHTTGTGWPDEMLHYIDVTTILLVEEFGIDPDRWLAGHKEYAPSRKPDPESLDCEAWRQRVKNRSPWGGPIKQKEWDELATKEEFRAVVREELSDIFKVLGRKVPRSLSTDQEMTVVDMLQYVDDHALRADQHTAPQPSKVDPRAQLTAVEAALWADKHSSDAAALAQETLDAIRGK